MQTSKDNATLLAKKYLLPLCQGLVIIFITCGLHSELTNYNKMSKIRCSIVNICWFSQCNWVLQILLKYKFWFPIYTFFKYDITFINLAHEKYVKNKKSKSKNNGYHKLIMINMLSALLPFLSRSYLTMSRWI